MKVPGENHGDHISHLILSDTCAGQQFMAFAEIVSTFQVVDGMKQTLGPHVNVYGC